MPKNPYKGKFTPKVHVEEIAPKITINTTVNVQSLIDAHLIYTGRESGKQYEWNRAGAIVSVYETDVPELLSKRLGGKPCCGGDEEGNRIFQLAN